MVKAKCFVYANEFRGFPKLSNFELIEEKLPSLADGEFLAKALYLSVDPYMRPCMTQFPLKTVMLGGQVAK
jgi:prostaglandin reductase 1